MNSPDQDNAISTEPMDDRGIDLNTEENEMRPRYPLKGTGHNLYVGEKKRGFRRVSRTSKGIKHFWLRLV